MLSASQSEKPLDQINFPSKGASVSCSITSDYSSVHSESLCSNQLENLCHFSEHSLCLSSKLDIRSQPIPLVSKK